MDDLSMIIEDLKKSIVIIKLSNGTSGTGFFLNGKGLLVTNKHIVQLSTFIRIKLVNDREVDAAVVFSNNDYDFSFAIADVENSVPLKLADSSALKEGKQVIAIGHPYGYDFTVSKGIISCKNRIVKGIYYVQTDVPINPGNSGGPLVNLKGEAVGMNTWVVGGADNMSFAVPINALKKTLDILNRDFDKLLSMYYCPICGFLNDDFIKTFKAEYCMNCGVQKMEKKKEKEIKAVDAQPQVVNVSMTNCPKCRTANDSSSNFCKNCGYRLHE
jgi:serine protease Do